MTQETERKVNRTLSSHRRLFVAAETSLVAGQLQRVARKQLDGERRLRWTPESNCHLTLRFIGEVKNDICQAISAALTKIQAMPVIELRVKEIAPFPRHRPVVLAAVIEPSEELTHLARQVERVVVGCGLSAAAKDLLPHITLARWGRGKQPPKLPVIRMNVATTITAFALVESELRPEGARYTRLRTYPLVAS